MNRLSPSERWTLLAIAEVATPPGEHIPLADAETIEAIESFIDTFGKNAMTAYRALLRAVDVAAVPLAGRPLSSLDPALRADVLERLARSDSTFWFVRAVTTPMKLVQARTSSMQQAFGSNGSSLSVVREHHRFEQRIIDARTLHDDETLEVDVVVVGTGAGGAPIAKELAARGHAVVMIEAGGYFTRADFVGRPFDLQQKLYYSHGFTSTLGNTVIPVPMGRTVGGTTTINSGTCFRLPEQTMRRWQLDNGLHGLGPGSLDAYYERVERTLEVETADPAVLGGCASVIARGAQALGYEHGPLLRNAPGCDGRGVCCFGCPTDAKRSTNVSYVPQAIEHGAVVYCNARVTRVLVTGGRAVGVVARTGGDNGVTTTLTVRARAVVLACGTLHTPALLLRQRLANSSGEVGKNLTIHPASFAWAQLDEAVRGWDAIPQGYSISEFADQGLRFEGAFLPLEMAAGAMAQVGERWTRMIEQFDKLACFGFMITDTSRGRVSLVGGKPRMSYVLADRDVRRIVQAHGILARVFFAGGARTVFPGMRFFEELHDLGDVERLEREGPERVRAHHLDLTAYHPLGTCRMGPDAARSVIGPTQETWDVRGLFVCDGSAVPGPLGVNPQLTIMALAERAAEFVERRVEEAARPVIREPKGTLVQFEETMTGMCQLDEGGVVDVSFTVRAIGGTSWQEALRERGGSWRLEGTIDAGEIASGSKCEGTLRMSPLRRRATLVYDLYFEDAEGREHTLHGEKHTGWSSLLRGMTTLHTELRCEGARIGAGILTFELAGLADWLRSWKIGARGSEPSVPPARS